MSTPQGWQTPKTDWDSKDPVGVSDLNRMEGNLLAIETGERTLDPEQAPSSNTGTLRQILSWFANRIKAITGKTNWYDAPDTTLAAAKSHINAPAPHSGHETPAGAQAKIDTHAADSLTHRQLVPPGAIMAFARSTPPEGWLECNGQAVSRTTYAALFAAIGTTFGAGDGSTTFNVPDLRGEFIRGWDHGRGVDAGRAFGSAQADALRSHNHTYTRPAYGSSLCPGVGKGWVEIDADVTGSTGGTETRPRNIALMYCIKY